MNCSHKAAKQGDPDAQYCLGRCYKEGIGVEKNEDMAKEWWHKAADQGNDLAQRSLEPLEVN